MPARELRTAAPEPTWECRPGGDDATSAPTSPRSGNGGQPDSVSDAGSRSRLPRITRLMALAIKFQDMVDRGEVVDYADLAKLGYVTRARLTQIMNLLLLAPEIQEEILVLVHSKPGGAPSERNLRRLSQITNWVDQRRDWRTCGSSITPAVV